MLKKLVKYGNSTALVLDKAILELLEMGEGSVVKIRTDGKSLIITPHESKPVETVVAPTVPEETLRKAVQQECARQGAECYTVPPTQEEMLRFGQAMGVLEWKYRPLMNQLSQNEDYIKDAVALQQKYAQDPYSPGALKVFLKAHIDLQKSYVPELAPYYDEMEVLQQEFEDKFGSKYPMGAGGLAMMTSGFRVLFEKPQYKAVMAKLAALADNEDYRHELVLLSEKYNHELNSQEYINEYLALRGKYVPESKEMDAEMKALAGSFGKVQEKYVPEGLSGTVFGQKD